MFSKIWILIRFQILDDVLQLNSINTRMNKVITVLIQPNENYNDLRYIYYIISSLIIAHVEQETSSLFPLFLP